MVATQKYMYIHHVAQTHHICFNMNNPPGVANRYQWSRAADYNMVNYGNVTYPGDPKWNISISMIYEGNGNLRMNTWDATKPIMSRRSCYYKNASEDRYIDLFMTAKYDYWDNFRVTSFVLQKKQPKPPTNSPAAELTSAPTNTVSPTSTASPTLDLPLITNQPTRSSPTAAPTTIKPSTSSSEQPSLLPTTRTP